MEVGDCYFLIEFNDKAQEITNMHDQMNLVDLQANQMANKLQQLCAVPAVAASGGGPS